MFCLINWLKWKKEILLFLFWRWSGKTSQKINIEGTWDNSSKHHVIFLRRFSGDLPVKEIAIENLRPSLSSDHAFKMFSFYLTTWLGITLRFNIWRWMLLDPHPPYPNCNCIQFVSSSKMTQKLPFYPTGFFSFPCTELSNKWRECNYARGFPSACDYLYAHARRKTLASHWKKGNFLATHLEECQLPPYDLQCEHWGPQKKKKKTTRPTALPHSGNSWVIFIERARASESEASAQGLNNSLRVTLTREWRNSIPSY